MNTTTELSRDIAGVAGIEEEARSERTLLDRGVDAITAFCGSMAFVWLHAVLFVLWMLVNAAPGVPLVLRFDPFPFQFLTLAVSLEAIFLSTFILISQNRQALIADRRSHLDLQVNLRAEHQNAKTLILLCAIAERLGVDTHHDDDLPLLEHEVALEDLVRQIKDGIEHHAPAHPAAVNRSSH